MSLKGAQQTAAATANDIKNSQVVQDLANGPVAQKAANEAAATKNEFGNLAASRQTPSVQTATGQNLTHYHSFFYNLLSWENPRATAVSYATIVLSILVFRYAPVAKYLFKALYIVLGITAAAEMAGKTLLNQGVATKLRPKKYYVVPQETLESIIVDVVELVNFFVIEFQRVVFAENVYATIAVSLQTLCVCVHGNTVNPADAILGLCKRIPVLLVDQGHAQLGSLPLLHHRHLLCTTRLHHQPGAHRRAAGKRPEDGFGANRASPLVGGRERQQGMAGYPERDQRV